MNKRGRPLNSTSRMRGPKAEAQAEGLWGQRAGTDIKNAMEARGWGYRELSEELAEAGIQMSAASLNRRINRANFSAAFYLISLNVLGVKVDVQLPESGPRSSAPKSTVGAKRTAKGLEAIIGGWASKKATE